MLINNKLLYEKAHLIQIGNPSDSLYYFFDYDERYYDINMEFQHFHNFYEIHILLDNDASHIIEGRLYRIGFFDIVCLKPYLLHKSVYPKGPAKKRLIIQFNIPVHAGLLQDEINEALTIFDAPLPIYRFEPHLQDLFINILNGIYQVSKSKSQIGVLSIHGKFLSFLSTIYNNRNHNIYIPESLNPTVSKIYTIASYIHSHYSEELTLESLSKKFYLSGFYLSHLFKKITGFTLINYIQMTRIRNAQQLLLFTDKKITEIAEECGFTSFSQFNRVFNKFCGTSPRMYKKQSGMLLPDSDTIPITYTRD